jgi:hypothetical protein
MTMTDGDYWYSLGKLKELVDESIRTNRPIESDTGTGYGKWVSILENNTAHSCLRDVLDRYIDKCYRVQPPVTEKMLISISENCWIRRNEFVTNYNECHFIVKRDNTNLYLADGTAFTIRYLKCLGYKWSVDLKEWHSFEV